MNLLDPRRHTYPCRRIGGQKSLAGRLLATARSRWQQATDVRQTLADRGTATAEYAIATLAACGFGGVLLALLRSSEVKSMLTSVIKRALTIG
jgi:hypothetical protein